MTNFEAENNFTELLQSLFSIIEESVSDNRVISGGEHLEMANTLKKLNTMRTQIKTNVVYIERERIHAVRQRRPESRVHLTRAEKLQSTRHAPCEHCGELLVDISLPSHYKTAGCIKTKQTKLDCMGATKEGKVIKHKNENAKIELSTNVSRNMSSIILTINGLLSQTKYANSDYYLKSKMRWAFNADINSTFYTGYLNENYNHLNLKPNSEEFYTGAMYYEIHTRERERIVRIMVAEEAERQKQNEEQMDSLTEAIVDMNITRTIVKKNRVKKVDKK